MPFCHGDTFLNNATDNLKTHLWVILSDPNLNSDKIVLVNFTTVYGNDFEDLSCVLTDGEHSFLRHDSYVSYRDAIIVSSTNLDALKKSNSIKLHDNCEYQLLRKILDGAEKTPFLKLEIYGILQEQGLFDT
jgi:hypothetical protein